MMNTGRLRLLFGVVGFVVFAAPAPAANLLALVDTGEIYVSADGGATWTGIATVTVSDAVDIYAGDTSSELYFGTRSGAVYRSTDGGATWNAQGTIPASDIVSVAHRVSAEVLALSASGAVYRSTDEGVSFTGIATLVASDCVSLVEQRPTGDLYALTETGAVYRSTDDGVSWAGVGVVLSPDAREIEAVGDDLFVMTHTGGIALSTDDGASWTFVGTLSQVGMRGMTVDGDTLVVGSETGHVATSVGGASWTWQGSVNQLHLMALGTDEPAASGVHAPRPLALALRSVFPNPGAGGAQAFVFSLQLGEADRVGLDVFDAAGRRVATVAAREFPTGGAHTLTWSPAGLASGVYFARLRGEWSGAVVGRKLVIVR
jgi:photosystem II stability/assembly factor-like uncharacterized protein